MKAEAVKKYNLYLQKKKWLRQLKVEGSELFVKQILIFPYRENHFSMEKSFVANRKMFRTIMRNFSNVN